MPYTITWKGFGKAVATIVAALAMLGAVGNGYKRVMQVDANKADIVLLDQRVTVLEQIKHDDHYMICTVFSQMVKAAVPASCNNAIR